MQTHCSREMNLSVVLLILLTRKPHNNFPVHDFTSVGAAFGWPSLLGDTHGVVPILRVLQLLKLQNLLFH